jgi:hypothetical protein
MMCCLATDPKVMDGNLQIAKQNRPFLVMTWLSLVLAASEGRGRDAQVPLYYETVVGVRGSCGPRGEGGSQGL